MNNSCDWQHKIFFFKSNYFLMTLKIMFHTCNIFFKKQNHTLKKSKYQGEHNFKKHAILYPIEYVRNSNIFIDPREEVHNKCCHKLQTYQKSFKNTAFKLFN